MVLETSTIVENFREQLQALTNLDTNITDLRLALLDAGVDVLQLPGLNNNTREDLRLFLNGETAIDPDGNSVGFFETTI